MAYVMRVSDWSSDVCSSDLRSGNRISESSRSSLSVSQAVEALSAATRNDAPAVVASLLDRLDADGRYALLKLALGGMRVGVSERLAKQAFEKAFDVPVDDVGENGRAPGRGRMWKHV